MKDTLGNLFCPQELSESKNTLTRIVDSMNKWQQWLENLSMEELTWLTAVFVSAMLGTIVSTVILRWGLSAFGEDGILAQLGICFLATAAYGGVVAIVFYVMFPETRLAFKRIFSNNK